MSKVFGFHGGIHPPENKHQSNAVPIADAGLPGLLILPLSQHIGAPAIPLVAVGDSVLKGQMIAEPAGFVSVPVHAPTSGRVSALEQRLIAHPSGHSAPCIVIEPDGQDKWLPHEGIADYQQAEPAQLLQRIREAGIAGMGGAGFPSAVKLSLKPGTAIDTLIINGTECEPYITADDVLMRERAGLIVEGSRIISHLVKPARTLIGVEDNKPEGLAALRAAAQGSDIEVVEFPTKYPSGGEKQLIEILTGKQVPSGGLPSEVGVVCLNVGTAVAVYDAVARGRPLISRITTVTGEAVAQPGNYEVLLGTPMSYLLQRAGYREADCERLIMGGPMMGFTVPDAEVPIVKTSNCLLAPSPRELPTPPPAQACIRCGMCAQACPASLLPQQLFWFSQGKEYEKLEHHHLFDCIECGACSWVCPSNIPLVQYYRASKAEVLELRADNQRSEHSRQRFEARQERLEQEEAKKEAKRAARKKAAEDKARKAAESGSAEDDPVQAAIERARAKKAAQAAGNSDGNKGESEQDKLEKTVVSTRKRLQTASAKLEQAKAEGSELVDALQTGVDKTRSKLEAAEKALQAHADAAAADAAAADAAAVSAAAVGTAAAPPQADAAQAAIARAMAARQAEAALSPEQKAQAQLQKLQQRLQKSESRLSQSRTDGDEEKIIEALESTVARLQQKIATAQSELTATEES